MPRGGGRLAPRVPQTTANEDGNIITANIQQAHTDGIRETEDHFKSEKSIKDHNRRLHEMIFWTKREYPEYCEEGVIELTEDQRGDVKRYYKSTHDFVYSTINSDITKAFLSSKKYHPNRKTKDNKPIHYSFSHLRKFYDAILFGSFRAKIALPPQYEMEMKSFIDSLKKEKVKAKKRGETDERESDPIPYELYRKLCKYAIDMGNMFVWAFTVTQWACMARSISIDDMTFANFDWK
jgi:hypothetical protein